jgi:hypothetical protein
MEYGKSIINGFLFGAGFVLAAAALRVALKIGMCG